MAQTEILKRAKLQSNHYHAPTYRHSVFTRATLCIARLLLSSRLSVRHTPVLHQNGYRYRHTFLGLVSPPLRFSNTTYGCKILTGRGACHSGGLKVFSVLERVVDTLRHFFLPLCDKPLLISLITFEFYQKTHIKLAVVNILINYRQAGCGSDGSMWKTEHAIKPRSREN